MRFHRWLASILAIVCFASPSVAQLPSPWGSLPTHDRRLSDTAFGTAWIVGTVKTSDGKPVDHATVALYGGQAKPVLIPTSEDGSFRIDNVSAGEYELVAEFDLNQAREHVSVISGENSITLVVPTKDSSKGKGSSVTAAQLAVPSKARHELEKAQVALRTNRVAEAARFVERALIAWPKYAEAFVLRATMERQQNAPQLAAADAEKAIQYDPNYPSAYFVLGSVYNDLNRSDDAVRTLDHGIVIGPDYWQGYFEMSRALLLKGDFTGALRQAEKSSSLAPPEFASLHLVKGYAYLGLKNSIAARSELEKYIKLQPNSEAADRVRQLLTHLTAAADDKVPNGDAKELISIPATVKGHD